jgi:capsular polysaccharide export protein
VNEPKTIHAVGFPLWKRRHVRTFLAPANVRFVRAAASVPPDGIAATWGLRIPAEQFPESVGVWRLEDGFLRSVGLGADLTTPISWVADNRGIYYDATRPSDLEHLLATHDFTPRERDRARALRARLLFAGLTKYNVGGKTWRRPSAAHRVILVPGQVESDASLRFGTNGISTNTDLVTAVRRQEPDAFIVYKPHPDVTARLRRLGQQEEAIGGLCDCVVPDIDMHRLLDQVDEVHTMTSLAGFEGLLRGKKVVTYGMPFYAGWGLTEDRDMRAATADRRRRRLDLDELVSAALVHYPRYADRAGRRLGGPEQAIDELLSLKQRKAPRLRPMRAILRLLAN